MLHKKQILAAIVALLATMGTLNAQEKFAIIIGGNINPNAQYIPLAQQWNSGYGAGQYGFDEFWNDTYLMWEMLIKEDGGKGFADANVHVLFGNGNDFTFLNQDYRYKAGYNNYQVVTDANSNKQTISNTFSSLANIITEDDFLFVWIMSHGGTNAFGSYFYSYDNQKVYDDELANWLASIAANKKVIFLSFPNSGGFEPELEIDGNIVITVGGSLEGASRADDLAPDDDPPYTQTFIENEVLYSITYNHGEINYHLFSSLTGETPFGETEYATIPLTDADEWPVDGFISVKEAFDWTDSKKTSPETMVYFDYFESTELSVSTSLEYPTLIIYDIVQGMFTSVKGLVGISYPSWLVEDLAGLTFEENAKVFLLAGYPDIWFSTNSDVVIDDHVSFISLQSDFGMTFSNDEIEIGDNVTFSAPSYDMDSFVMFFNENLELEINSLFVSNCNLQFDIPSISLTNSDFELSKCGILSGTAHISDCIFESSCLTSSYNETCRIENCDFRNELPEATTATAANAIVFNHCDYYSIIGCDISDYLQNGIDINYSGNSTGIRSIQNNNIVSNGWSGIELYNSYAELTGQNNISGSDVGINCFNNSQVKILGNKNAVYVNETQQIHDNNINQIFATEGSFPYYIRFNAIYDEDNDCLVEYEPSTGNEPNLEVIYNFWGQNFDPEEDLCPDEFYSWSPVWSLQFLNENIASDEQMFNVAITLADSGNYAQAKTTYQQVAATYPSSKYATASLKELFIIEQSAGNEYASLKAYYINLMNQHANDELGKIADFLSNLCDIKLENFQDAITWYESVIQAPPSFADSLFAIIDLGHLYFLMEKSGYKSAISANMPQYQPVSEKQHGEYRDYLLSLLFKDETVEKKPENGLMEDKATVLLPNIPNPFWEKTTIRYVVNEAEYIRIMIADNSGRLVATCDEGWKEPGQYQLALTSENLVSGVYFCTVESNGMRTDSQKISVMK